MPLVREVLTDAAAEIHHAECRLAGESEKGAWSIEKRTLRGGVSDGVDVVSLASAGGLSVSVLPTRGMGLWKAEYRGLDVGWRSPVSRPVHPAFVDLSGRNGLGWLAGFNELMCRCGLAWNGPPIRDIDETPLTLHGRVANLPAHRVVVEVSTDGEASWLSVTGVVEETSMFGPHLELVSTVRTEAGSNRLTIADTITNHGASPAEVELLYHTNIGPPFLGAGSRFLAPVELVAPRDARAAEGIATWQTYEAPTPGFAEQAYYLKPRPADDGRTIVLLRTASGERGVSVEFDVRQLPWFVLWKNTQAEAEGYVTGLEPTLDLPNARPFEREQSRLPQLEPGASLSLGYDLAVHDAAESVAEVEARIATLAAKGQPTVHRTPQPEFSPPG